MLKARLIPLVLYRDGFVVQSKGFTRYQRLGDATRIVERLSDWAADELIYLDIGRSTNPIGQRSDIKVTAHGGIIEVLRDVASRTFMPLAFGGGIRTLDDVLARIRAGADKVVVNTHATRDPSFITEIAREFGSQCVVVSIDAKRHETGWRVWLGGGRDQTDLDPFEWARQAEERGAGEILINSIDRDGTGAGYDLELVRGVASSVGIPVIACGGVGEWSHFVDALEAGVGAVAAANIFHYTENSVYNAKRFLYEAGMDVRVPTLTKALEAD